MSDWTGSIPCATRTGTSPNAARICATFRSPGANDATANSFFAWRHAIPTEAVPMKKMYGNTARVRATVRSNSPGRPWYPAAKSSVSSRAKTIPSAVATASARSEAPRTRCTKARAGSSPSSASFALRTGTSALDIVPSARSWRSAFGIVNATKKASVSSRVKSAARTTSRARPRTRDASVPRPTTPARRTSFERSAAASCAALGGPSVVTVRPRAPSRAHSRGMIGRSCFAAPGRHSSHWHSARRYLYE